MTRRALLATALVAVAFVAGALLGERTSVFDGIGNSLFGERPGDVTAQALEVIEDHYYREVDAEQLESDSVRAMVGALKRNNEDRFSHYFDPEAYARFQESTSGSFSGVGMTVTGVPRGLRVATVFEGSPAEQAGIEPGDVITAVDGESIAGEGTEVSTARIKGEEGTDVTLTVRRPSTGRTREVTLTRATVRVPVVEGRLREVDGVKVGYVRLLGFPNGAGAELRKEVESLYDQGAEGIVLDLRGNGGGLLNEAVLTSSVFVEDGVIVSTEGRTSPKETFDAVGDALPEHPIVVLINGDTASAAEILTAALVDAGLAETVGERSFGKGTFQQVISLDNGGALDLTIGEYKTRNGKSVNNVGITPDFVVAERPGRPGDEQLRRALAIVATEASAG